MLFPKKPLAREVYKYKRHWYHISTTLKRFEVILKPRDNDSGFNRADTEPDNKRICVSPTLEQCLVAVPYYCDTKFTIYRTSEKLLADKSYDVFDSSITQEGWITIPTKFYKIGSLKIEDIAKDEEECPDGKVIEESATSGLPCCSKETYRWWKYTNPWNYVKFTEYGRKIMFGKS